MATDGECRIDARLVSAKTSVKFSIALRGRRCDGFVIHSGGRYRAYVNRCPHVGTPLDLWPNEFFSEDGSLLVCATHGATFDPLTGDCVDGPCSGDRLDPLPVRVDGADIVIGGPSASARRGTARVTPSGA